MTGVIITFYTILYIIVLYTVLIAYLALYSAYICAVICSIFTWAMKICLAESSNSYVIKTMSQFSFLQLVAFMIKISYSDFLYDQCTKKSFI